MKKYLLLTILGLFLLAYLLEAVVEPLSTARVGLTTPYDFFKPQVLALYGFSTAIVVIRALGILLTPVLLASFVEKNQLAKGGATLVLSALMQLYAVQDVVTKAKVIPLEWSIALAGGGALLLAPAFFWIIQGITLAIHYKLVGKVRHNIQHTAAKKSPTWLDANEEKNV